jgi:hypothetical protein
MKSTLVPLAAALLIGIAGAQTPAPTSASPAPPANPAAADAPLAYGWQLMSDEERAAYRQKMRTLTNQEREQFQQAHHEAMKVRARSRRGRGRGPGRRPGRRAARWSVGRQNALIRGRGGSPAAPRLRRARNDRAAA